MGEHYRVIERKVARRKKEQQWFVLADIYKENLNDRGRSILLNFSHGGTQGISNPPQGRTARFVEGTRISLVVFGKRPVFQSNKKWFTSQENGQRPRTDLGIITKQGMPGLLIFRFAFGWA